MKKKENKEQKEKLERIRKFVIDDELSEELAYYPDINLFDFHALMKIHNLVVEGTISEQMGKYLRDLLYQKIELCEKTKDIVDPKENVDGPELARVYAILQNYHLYDNGFCHQTDELGHIDPRKQLKEEMDEGKIGGIIIDSYHYCYPLDDEKKAFYKKHENTEEENEKTESFNKKLDEFIAITEGEDEVEHFHNIMEGSIYFREGIGYITDINPDRDDVDIYYYGDTEELAFINACAEYELNTGRDYEWLNRQQLADDFARRFPDDANENRYYGLFFAAEWALKQYQIYYGENIPEIIKTYFERFLGDKFRYDYGQNCVIKREKNLEPRLIKPEDK